MERISPVAPSSSVPVMFPAPSPVPQGGGVFNPSPSPVLIQNGSAENVTQKPFASHPQMVPSTFIIRLVPLQMEI